jgi:hypothetical protein
MIFHVPDTNSGFFPELAFDSILERLTGFYEARQGRVELGRKLFLISKRSEKPSYNFNVDPRFVQGEFCPLPHSVPP